METEKTSNWWNTTCLDPPPFLVYPITIKQTGARRRLGTIINNLKDRPTEKYLELEIAILKRLMFKMNRQYRRCKKFQAMQRVRVCLDKFSRLDVDKAFDMFSPGEDDENVLGSRQMLEYVLTKTVCAVHLLSRTCDHCFSAVEILCADLALKMIASYDEMHSLLKSLHAAPVPWIPEGQELPTSLKDFCTAGSLKYVQRRDERGNSKKVKLDKVDAESTLPELKIDKVNLGAEDIGTSVSRTLYAAAKTDESHQTSKERLKRKINRLRTRKQILLWLRLETEKLKNNSRTDLGFIGNNSWKNIRKFAKNTLLTSEKPNTAVTWVKNTLINWFDDPSKYLKLYKNDKLHPDV